MSRVCRIERKLVKACPVTRAPPQQNSLLAAWPVFSRGCQRTTVIAEAAQGSPWL